MHRQLKGPVGPCCPGKRRIARARMGFVTNGHNLDGLRNERPPGPRQSSIIGGGYRGCCADLLWRLTHLLRRRGLTEACSKHNKPDVNMTRPALAMCTQAPTSQLSLTSKVLNAWCSRRGPTIRCRTSEADRHKHRSSRAPSAWLTRLHVGPVWRSARWGARGLEVQIGESLKRLLSCIRFGC